MKKLLLFAAILCTFMSFTQAQDATINANRVKYWVGTGNNQAIFIVNWCEPDTALAWGFKFSEDSLLVSDMLTAITTADPRFSTQGTSSWLTNLIYIDGSDTFKIATGDYVVYNRNGGYANTVDLEYFYPNDYLKFGGWDCADMDENWTSTWSTPIEPVEIPGVPVADATINVSEIQYWVGTGSNEVRFIVDWNSTALATAWGYRFDGESVLVSTILDDIATADPRFSYAGTTSWLSDLKYFNGTDTLTISPDYVVYNVNGSFADAADAQAVHAGDYVKFGGYMSASLGECRWIEDPAWGDYWDYAYVWTNLVIPVPSPVSVNEYNSQKLSVYPNPCTESIRIQTNINDDVVMYNLQGAVVMSTVAMDEVTTLDVNNLPSGIYFVKSGNKTAKIVKR
jgi:hypothetical protein